MICDLLTLFPGNLLLALEPIAAALSDHLATARMSLLSVENFGKRANLRPISISFVNRKICKAAIRANTGQSVERV